MEIEITKLSSKGQIVIPFNMRREMKEGERIVLIKHGNKIILKKASDMDEQLHEDLEFAKRTEEAYKRIESGKGITMDFDSFIEEAKKW